MSLDVPPDPATTGESPMRHHRSLVALLFALLGLFVLSACGGDDDVTVDDSD